MAAPSPKGYDIRARSLSTKTWARSHEWQKLLLRPDITNCLAFSKLRCLISIISILLLATDIPRSGLGVKRLNEYYSAASILPDTAIRFGPYDYPVRHISRAVDTENSFSGLEGADPVDSANVWSYKYDTTSLGLRGAVELLNVTEYPDFLLYRGKLGHTNDHKAILQLNTTFFMLDALISAVQTRVQAHGISSKGVSSPLTPLRFAIKYNWVDRVHQYVTKVFRRNRLWSLHSLHAPRISRENESIRMCSMVHNAPLRPRFCNYPGIWECQHPLNASLPAVRISDQMDIRFRDLRRRYPDLLQDVALFSTHRPFITSGTLRYTFFNGEEQEIVMLTRGRRCVGNETRPSEAEDDSCTTIFVDDYRYERDILHTNIVDWYFFIAMMRAGAQGYFWARLVLLFRTAFLSTKEEERHHWHSQVISAVTILFRIPFQVIVYSSLLPVVGYVVALLLDGPFMDIFLDAYWSTLEGASNLRFVSFLNSAVTQMRTVWLMALLADLMVMLARKPINRSEEKIPGIRGLVISFTSALTIIGPYRQTTLRNTEIVEIFRLPEVGQKMDIVQSEPQWFFNKSTYMLGDSIAMLVFCVGVVAATASAARLVSFCMRVDRELVLISTLNVPYGTEFLWPTSSMSIRFNALTSCTRYQYDLCMRPSTVKISPERQYFQISAPSSPHLNSLQVSPSPSFNVAGQRETATIAGASPHRTRLENSWLCCGRKCTEPLTTNMQEPLGGLCSRTPESHSILQLMNIAMMTDPWNFVWLRVFGIRLYLYRIQPTRSAIYDVDNSTNLVAYAVILPYAEEEMEERTGLSFDDFQLLDSATSTDVPMVVLLQCG